MTLMIGLLILGVVATILIVAFILIKREKHPKYHREAVTLFNCDIKTLADRIATENLDMPTFMQLIEHMTSHHPFPTKKGEENRDYLRFVHQFCLNPKVNGTMIVKMNSALKKRNPEYAEAIEKLEKEAIKARDSR